MHNIKETSEIFVIPNFLTAEECDELIVRSEAIGYEEAKVNIDGAQKTMKSVRDNERVLFADMVYAFQLWKKLKAYIRPVIGNSYAIGLNELFRFYRYTPGQRFKMHRDGSYVRNDTEFSYYTFMIYLNDDYEGGQTKFQSGEYVDPQKGSALIFQHNLMHEGAAVKSGTKYVLRTDVMYKYRSNGE